MPCIPIMKPGRKKPIGFLCIGNEPVEVKDGNKSYFFEWTAGSGWMPCNKDGSERLTKVPNHIWDRLVKEHNPDVSRDVDPE